MPKALTRHVAIALTFIVLALLLSGCDEQKHASEQTPPAAPKLPSIAEEGPVELRNVVADGSTFTFSGARAAALRRLVRPESQDEVQMRPKSERLPGVPHGVLVIDGVEFPIFAHLVLRGKEADLIYPDPRALALWEVIHASAAMTYEERLGEISEVIDGWGGARDGE